MLKSAIMTLGQKIEKLRKLRGFTQTQLAQKMDMTPHHLSRWENDRIRPRDKTLEKLAQALEVSPDELAVPQANPSELAQNDSELAFLLHEIPSLDEEQKQVLKHVLRSMVTCNQMQRVVEQVRRPA